MCKLDEHIRTKCSLPGECSPAPFIAREIAVFGAPISA